MTRAALAALLLTIAVSGCGGGKPLRVVAVGDIADCRRFAAQTAILAQSLAPDLVLALGDQAYPDGSMRAYRECYDPTWGVLKSITYPVVGNHEYVTGTPSAYFTYFGSRAGTPGQGWYSFDRGGWHFIALNTNCSELPDGCGPTSAEGRWLANDLAHDSARCTVAMWHEPRFSAGPHGNNVDTDALWNELARHGVDLALTGHDHDYQRFEPVDGITEFVVGTGGGPQDHGVKRPYPHVVTEHSHVYGVLELNLHSDSYDWRFLPIPGQTFTDSGSARCH